MLLDTFYSKNPTLHCRNRAQDALLILCFISNDLKVKQKKGLLFPTALN